MQKIQVQSLACSGRVENVSFYQSVCVDNIEVDGPKAASSLPLLRSPAGNTICMMYSLHEGWWPKHWNSGIQHWNSTLYYGKHPIRESIAACQVEQPPSRTTSITALRVLLNPPWPHFGDTVWGMGGSPVMEAADLVHGLCWWDLLGDSCLMFRTNSNQHYARGSPPEFGILQLLLGLVSGALCKT